MTMKVIIFALIILFCFSSCVFGATYYVKNGGNDALDGLSLGNAWEHITKACSTLVAGDTVFIKSGTYDEKLDESVCPLDSCGALTARTSGSAGNYIVYKNYPGDPRPVIKGNGCRNHGILIWGQNYIILDSLELTESFRGIQVAAANNIIIKNCKVHHTVGPCNDNNGGVMLGLESNDSITVEACSLYHNWEVCDGETADGWNCSGIHVYRTKNSVIQNNVIWDQPSGFGIRLKWIDTSNVVRNNIVHDCNVGLSVGEDGFENQFYENIVYYTTDGGFVIVSTESYGGGDSTKVYNNTFYESEGAGVKLYPNSTIYNFRSWNNIVVNSHGDYGVGEDWTLSADNHPGLDPDYNDYWDAFETDVVYWHGNIYNLADYQSLTGLDDHSIQSNPLFVDTAEHDFHLQAGSPCKGTGLGGADMGAYPSGQSQSSGKKIGIRKH
jgi:hypothetical protein